MDQNIGRVLEQLTLEEKAGLCSGKDFWHLKGVKRLDIPEIMVTDGPHGLRKQNGETDHVGLAASVPTTCFPTASATASSWDRNLIYEMGVALAQECLEEDVAVLLGPGVNIKRSPLCGRNFEYISEDPFVAGEMGAKIVQGIQSMGVGTSLKHFAANNQEYRRMYADSVMDERTFREIYLSGFEKVVKEAQPWTVMCAYNRIEGIYCSDNKKLLTDILKEEWGHTGLVVTDWGACNDRVEGIRAGLELEMPASGGLNDKKIVDAVNDGSLSMEVLDKAVVRVLELIKKSEDHRRPDYTYDKDEHHRLARKVASESAVLLKNEGALPLSKDLKVAVIGEFAKNPRYQGAGSSLINPYQISTALDGFDEKQVSYTYYQGYSVKSDMVDEDLMIEAIEGAKEADVAVVFVGLTEDYESEGFDRKHISMPYVHNKIVMKVSQVAKKVVVVLQNGAPVSMPWLDRVDGVLECYLGGQAGGLAAVDLLYGDVNPSGKLAETFPKKLEDDLATNWFAVNKKTVEYRESLYIGYRLYDKTGIQPLFPFGYGLSYTTFAYENLRLEKESMKDDETVTVTVTIRNTGSVAGAEIVQLYVGAPDSVIFRADKELKGFDKVHLNPGETADVTMTLDKRSFAYYNVDLADWHVIRGEYQVLVGGSSMDLPLSATVFVDGANQEASLPDFRESAPEYYDPSLLTHKISDTSFEALIGRPIPPANYQPGELFDINSTVGDISKTLIGKQIYKMVAKQFGGMMASETTENDETTKRMMEAMINDLPLRSMVLFAGGQGIDFEKAQLVVDVLNGKYIESAKKLFQMRGINEEE